VWCEEADDGGEGEGSSSEGFTVKLERATAFHYDKVRKRSGLYLNDAMLLLLGVMQEE